MNYLTRIFSNESCNYKTEDVPLIFNVHGHWGLGIEQPENTIAAFMESSKLGLDFVELDVWLTSDNIPVVIHADSELGHCKMLKKSDCSPIEIFVTKTSYEDLNKLTYCQSGYVFYQF